MSPDGMVYLREQCLTTIRAHGWMVAGHNRSELSPRGNITYTAGLTEAGIPELVVAELPHDPAGVLLNSLARRHLDSELHAGDEVPLSNAVTLRLIDAPGVIAPIARSLYGRRARFLQVLWPDGSGRFPNDPDWPADLQRQAVYDQPLPDYLLPDGDGLVGVLDQIEEPGT